MPRWKLKSIERAIYVPRIRCFRKITRQKSKPKPYPKFLKIDQWECFIQIAHCRRGLECKQREHDFDWKLVNRNTKRAFMKNLAWKSQKCLYSSQTRKKSSVQPLELVTCTRWEVKLLSEHILHGVYSAFDTLFPYYLLLNTGIEDMLRASHVITVLNTNTCSFGTHYHAHMHKW